MPCRIVSVLQAAGRLVHGGNVDCVIIITIVVVACWANKTADTQCSAAVHSHQHNTFLVSDICTL